MNSSVKPQIFSLLDTPIAKTIGFVSDILGVVGGVIGVITFLLAFRQTDGKLQITYIDSTLTPLHILGLWIVSAYIYICFLYSSWKKRREKHSLRHLFWMSLKDDFIIQFRYPYLLLPCMILLILLIWIIIEMSLWNGEQILTILLVTFFLLVPVVLLVGLGNMTTGYDEKQVKAFKKDVDTNWTYWEDRIKLELKKRGVQYISTDKFTDIIELWRIKSQDITYVFTCYASLHYVQVQYGNVYNYEDDKPLYPDKILAKRSAEWSDDYYFR